MIDLKQVYREVGEVLDAAGLGNAAYALGIDWWNHRHGAQVPECSIYVSGDAYVAATFDEAVIQLRAALGLATAKAPDSVLVEM